MKKITAILTAAAAICLAACTNGVIIDADIPDSGVDAPSGPALTITHGSLTSKGGNPATRRDLKNGNEIWWTYNDGVNVYPPDGDYVHVYAADLEQGEFARTATFKHIYTCNNPFRVLGSRSSVANQARTESGSGRYYVTTPNLFIRQQAIDYPNPSPIEDPDGSYDPENGVITLYLSEIQRVDTDWLHYLPSLGSFKPGETDSFTMTPLCGGLRFFVERDDITRIELNFSGNVSGYFTVSNLDGTPVTKALEDGSPDLDTITLRPFDKEAYTGRYYFIPGQYYYVPLIPGLIYGLTAKLYLASGDCIASYSNLTQTIKPGVFGTITKPLESYYWDDTEYVDLGLTVVWATCNVGASKPQEYGDYFGWGEVEPYYEPGYAQSDNPVWKPGKEDGYVESNNRYNCGPNMWTKYNSTDKLAGFGMTSPKYEDDPARANWGSSWRLPTAEEFQELIDNCDVLTEYDYEGSGVKGRVFRGRGERAGQSIFLPFAGVRDGVNLELLGDVAYYWTSSYDVDGGYPYYLWGYVGSGWSINTEVVETQRQLGLSVRPVRSLRY